MPESCKDVCAVTASTLSAPVGLGWHWQEQEVELRAAHAAVASCLLAAMGMHCMQENFGKFFFCVLNFHREEEKAFLKCYGFGAVKNKFRLEWWQGGVYYSLGSQNSVLETQSPQLPFERARGLIDGTWMKLLPCHFIINIIII